MEQNTSTPVLIGKDLINLSTINLDYLTRICIKYKNTVSWKDINNNEYIDTRRDIYNEAFKELQKRVGESKATFLIQEFVIPTITLPCLVLYPNDSKEDRNEVLYNSFLKY